MSGKDWTRAASLGLSTRCRIRCIRICRRVAEPKFHRRLAELGGASPTSGNTVVAFNQVTRQELAVLPKKAVELGLKLD